MARVALPGLGGGWVDTLFDPMADKCVFWERTWGGHFVLPRRGFWPKFFSQVVARLCSGIRRPSTSPLTRVRPGLPAERVAAALHDSFAGLCVAENAVSEHIAPFADAVSDFGSQESLMAWVFFLQRRDEDRHALFFDRIAAEVLGLPGATPAERREGAAPRPAHAARALRGAAAGNGRGASRRAAPGWARASPSPHGARGHHLRRRASRAAPRPGRRRPARGTRGRRARRARRALHIGFGLRCLVEAQPLRDLLDDLPGRAPRTLPGPGATLSRPQRASTSRTFVTIGRRPSVHRVAHGGVAGHQRTPGR